VKKANLLGFAACDGPLLGLPDRVLCGNPTPVAETHLPARLYRELVQRGT
jgi:hypothetical protein